MIRYKGGNVVRKSGIGRCSKTVTKERFEQVCLSIIVGDQGYKKLDWLPRGWMGW